MKFTFLLLFMCGSFLTAQNIPLYVGTYTNGESKGIYCYNFNTTTGKLTNKRLAVEAKSPSFLSISSDRKYLYAVSEAGSDNGGVNAYSINKNGLLSFINQVSSEGNGPCHVVLNKDNNKMAVSNYGGGTIALYNIKKNGSIENAFQVFNHNLPGVKSHAHSAKFFNNNLFIADLGRNFLSQYTLKDDRYVSLENYSMAKKAGPRHFKLTDKGDFIYVINELNATITALKREGDRYTEIQTIGTTRSDYKGMNSCADIHLSKDENFLYGSNRGENTIAVFKRNKQTGEIQKIQSISVEGDWPRNFVITPNGKFLLVANQKSNNISIYKVNNKTGELSFMHSEKSDAPVCLVF